jgi:hypothetical protein
VKMLAFNQQTTGPQTEAVLVAAKRNNIPVVPVTETAIGGPTTSPTNTDSATFSTILRSSAGAAAAPAVDHRHRRRHYSERYSAATTQLG